MNLMLTSPAGQGEANKTAAGKGTAGEGGRLLS